MVETLLRAGAKPDLEQESSTPLSVASGRGNARAVLLLLRAGADVNRMLSETDRWSQTPLIAAVEHNQIEIIHILFSHGADPTIRCRRGAALDLAVEYRYSQAAGLIREALRRRPSPGEKPSSKPRPKGTTEP